MLYTSNLYSAELQNLLNCIKGAEKVIVDENEIIRLMIEKFLG